MKFFDFCSGIGAARVALEQLGNVCVGHSEIEPKAEKLYNIFFKENKNYGDITKINPKNLPEFDLLVAGFPCQTFSIAGKREGFNDDRGKIIFSIINILKEKNIKYFILENVKGLENHNNKETLKEILKELENINYNVKYKIINSNSFDTIQKRERLYIVGVRKDLEKEFKFPNKIKRTKEFKYFLDNKNNKLFDLESLTFKNYLNNKYNKGKYTKEDILKLENCIIDTRQSDIRIYKESCPTLRNQRNGLFYIRNKKAIKLNGYEGLLLQGFTKELAKKAKESDLSDNQILNLVGNSMTVTVIKEIAKKIGG